MPLAYGAQLPVQAQSVLMSTDTWEADAGPAELLEAARAFDAHGFDYVGVCDHFAIPRSETERMGTTWYDLMTTLGWLAGVTTRVRLLSHVLVAPYRHPAQVAKAFSTLDVLSGGRAVLGLGAGHLEAEFDLLGASYSARAERLEETVRVARSAFADEWGLAACGLGDLGQRPRPVQAGGPPIWIGGSTPAALRRAALLGDGWLPQGPPRQGLRAAIADLQRMRSGAGRDGAPFAVNAGLVCYVGTPSWETGSWCKAGPASEVAASVSALASRGVTHVQVRLRSRSCSELVDQVAAFAGEVVPLVEEVA
jgi:probable F420-dependent oxidoreductase